MPEAPSSALPGKNRHCSTSEMAAVIRIAAKQGTAAVFFFQRRADNQEEQHIVEEMFPTGMAQHMAEEPDIEKRIRQGGAVHAEQMGGGPPAGEGCPAPARPAREKNRLSVTGALYCRRSVRRFIGDLLRFTTGGGIRRG